MQQTHQGVLIEITYQYLLPWVNLNLFFGYTFLPSSRRAAPRSQPAPGSSSSSNSSRCRSNSRYLSPACCTPWSGDPNDHTDGHRIIPCPWNRFHLCEVPMNRNHRIKLIPS
eukprot:g8624.t1